MKTQISCEQFIYSKYTKKKYSSYDVVAKSPGIADNETISIRKLFDGCRPRSTNIENYGTAFAVSPISEDFVALLRLARSNEEELGRGYYINEHYIILNSQEIKNAQSRLWLWLKSIPNPSSIHEYTELKDSLSLDSSWLNSKIKSARQGLLSSNPKYFKETVITSAYYLLHANPVSIISSKQIFDDWTWFTALSILLPTSKASKTRVYIGGSYAGDWSADLRILERSPPVAESKLINLYSSANDILSREQITKGYAKLGWRCLESEDIKLFNELVGSAEKVDISPPPINLKTHLDELLWKATLPKVGLRLASRELGKSGNEETIPELHWLWCNSEKSFSNEDVEEFLPVLIKYLVNKWNTVEFQVLGRILSRMENQIGNLAERINLVDESEKTLQNMLNRWITIIPELSELENSFYAFLLQKLAQRRAESAIDILVQWIPSLRKKHIWCYFPRIINGISKQGTISTESSWKLIITLLSKIIYSKDIKEYYLTLKETPLPVEFSPVKEFFARLSRNPEGNTASYSKSLSEFTLLARQSNTLPNLIKTIVPVLLYAKKANAFTAFVFDVCSSDSKAFSKSGLELGQLDELQIWVLSSKDTSLIATFLFVLSRTGNKLLSREMLTYVLHDDVGFNEVVNIMQARLGAEQNDLGISINLLENLTSGGEQLSLFLGYAVSIQYHNIQPGVFEKIYLLLDEVGSLADVSSRIKDSLLNRFQSFSEWGIYRKILEHQIRTAIYQKNFNKSRPLLSRLEAITPHLGISHFQYAESKFMAKTIISYFDSLSDKRKTDLISWLLTSPLKDQPKLAPSNSQPLTSRWIINEPFWFVDDIVVRLSLYNKVMNTITKRI